MKKVLFCMCTGITLLLVSCSNGAPGKEESVVKEKEPCLEDILDLKSEEDLIKKYGKESVSDDTIWGAEGYFTLGTHLRTDEYAHIEILWADSTGKKGMISATLVSDADYYAEKLQAGKWKSCTGAYLGMSTDDLQKLNGRPFKFSGFGWDYGGGVISWEDGTLDKKGMAVQLSEGASGDLTTEESNQVLGDVPVMSNNPALEKLKPRVWSISVAKVN
jgi:hypothetical protein